MKRRSWLILPALLAIVIPTAIAAYAGGDHAKCTAGTQECLDMMAAKMKNHGWVGLEMDKSDDGQLSVKRVVPDSPAVAAGFKEGDILVAVNGVKYAEANEEALMKAKKAMAPGKQVTYTISRGGYEKKLNVTLAEVPQEVLAQWVGNHMLEHVQVAQAQK